MRQQKFMQEVKKKYKKELQGDTSLKGGEKRASHAKGKAISESDDEKGAR